MAVEKLPPKMQPVNLEDIERSGKTLAELCLQIMPHKDTRGKLVPSIENLKVLLDILKIEIRYNVISKEVELLIPQSRYSIDNSYNASLAHIASKLKQGGMSTDFHREYLLLLADENQYNPVEQWITRKRWDGSSRLQEFYDTVETKPEHKATKEALMFRWLVGAVASACSPNGIDSAGILVLQGGEGLGKTWWVKKLVPIEEMPNLIRDGGSIDPHDKDSVEQAIAYWIVELGELDATFKKSEIAALKAFITRDHDIFRKAFAARPSRFPRRTVFVASVNPWHFLVDESGNRRFWTIECEKVDSYHTIDMQQLWREVYDKWKDGDTWRLNTNEKEELKEINSAHLPADPIMEHIAQKFNWDAPNIQWRWLTATQILEEIGIQRITKAETRICADVVRKMNGGLFDRKANNRLLWVPPKTKTKWENGND